MSKPLYHYTTLHRLRMILFDGAIIPQVLPEDLSEGPETATTKPEPVWLSEHSVWEPGADIMTSDDCTGEERRFTLDELVADSNNPVRVQVSPVGTLNVYEYFRHQRGSEEPESETREVLEEWTRDLTDLGCEPNSWRCSFEPIEVGKFRAIEIWDGELWRIHSVADLVRSLKSSDRFDGDEWRLVFKFDQFFDRTGLFLNAAMTPHPAAIIARANVIIAVGETAIFPNLILHGGIDESGEAIAVGDVHCRELNVIMATEGRRNEVGVLQGVIDAIKGGDADIARRA